MLGAFVLETGVDILSRARVRVTHCAFLRLPFRVVKMLRRSPRSSFLRNYRVAHSFSLRVACLAGHGKLCSSSDYKTKSPHCCVSFLFWKPASTRRDPRLSLSVPLRGTTFTLRAVAPLRNGKMQAVPMLLVPTELSHRLSFFRCVFLALSRGGY